MVWVQSLRVFKLGQRKGPRDRIVHSLGLAYKLWKACELKAISRLGYCGRNGLKFTHSLGSRQSYQEEGLLQKTPVIN